MQPLARMIDANFNRAREALRVLDDVARFAAGNAALCEQAKNLRHQLVSAITALPLDRAALLASRDTPGDVGTAIATPAEYTRRTLYDVAQAAAARLTEALRSLEESSKALGAIPAAKQIESTRYAAYTLEKELLTALGPGVCPQWRLCVILSESLCLHHPWTRVAELAIEGGADCLQLREKTLDSAELLRRARTLTELARPRGVAVIINDRPDIALLCGAQGVHVGQLDLPVAAVRELAGARLFVGVSTESPQQALAAFACGADYCGVGPMFATTTKHKPRLAGPQYLREYLALSAARPHLAIGGVTPSTIPELAASGCQGVAVSSCVCSAADPRAVCRQLRAHLPP